MERSNLVAEIGCHIRAFLLRLDISGNQIGLQRASRPANARTFQQPRDIKPVGT
jgi:hypothetical protein